jgi:hypothetical protein
LYRQLPTARDHEVFEKVKSTPPTAAQNPNLFAWFCLVGHFTEALRATWGASAGAAQGKGKQAAPKTVEPKVEAKVEEKVEEKPAEDDDMGLFDDDEEDSVSLLLLTLLAKNQGCYGCC